MGAAGAGQGAVVLLITDGLDREGARGPRREHGPAAPLLRRLIWLNPLLRWDGFEPKSQGIRAMLPHVDEFRPVHNLASLRVADRLLSRPAPARAGADAWRHRVMSPTEAEDVLTRRRQLARGRRAGGARDRDRDLGQLAPPGRQPDGGRPPRAHGRLGLRRLHRGRGRRRRPGRRSRTGSPQLLDFGVTNERAWEVGLACGGKVKVFVEKLA